MPRKKRAASPFELYDDDFDEDASSQSSRNGHPPVQRNAANARERLRMRVLSSAYGRLKTKLPNIPPDTKLSKLDTLRLATLYIKQLIAAVENGTSVSGDSLDTNQMVEQGVGIANGSAFGFQNTGQGSMSWPFEFHNSSRHMPFPQMRMDWCQNNLSVQDSYTQKLQHNTTQQQPHHHQQQQQHSHDVNSPHMSQLQVHWYSQEALPQHHHTNSDTSSYMFQELQEQSTHHQRTVQHMHHQQSH